MSIGPASMLEAELSRFYEEAEALKPVIESLMKTCPDPNMRELIALKARQIEINNMFLATMAQAWHGIPNPFSEKSE